MGECPTCGRKINGDVCPYCGEEVREVTSQGIGSVSSESMVEVYTCTHQWQADFIVSLLESEGIPAYQRPGSAVGGLEYPPVETSGGISILVAEEDYEKAREVIEAEAENLEAD